MAYVSYLMSLLMVLAVAGFGFGLVAYVIGRHRGQIAQGQTVSPIGAEAWTTPIRAVVILAAIAFAAIVYPLCYAPSAIGFLDSLTVVLLLAGICWVTPAGLTAPTEVSAALIASIPLVIAAILTVLIMDGTHYSHAYDHTWDLRGPVVSLSVGLVVAAIIRAKLGIPESAWYESHKPVAVAAPPAVAQPQTQAPVGAGPVITQPAAAAPKPKANNAKRHMVLPPLGKLGQTLMSRVHGQKMAIAKLVAGLGHKSDWFSAHSIEPLIVVFAGPDSCGRQRLARELAHAVGGQFWAMNSRGEKMTDDAIYDSLMTTFRINGEPRVTYFCGFQGCGRATAVLSDILIKGHHAGDDWTRSIVVIPLDISAELPADKWELINVLSQHIDRSLLTRAIIVPMMALTDDDLIYVARQIALDEASAHGIEIASLTDEALVDLIADRDQSLPGARPVEAAVQNVMRAKIMTAKNRGWKRVDLSHDASGLTMAEAPKA